MLYHILKTIKNATDTSVVFLVHRKLTHFVYALTGFPFVRERLSVIVRHERHCALLLKMLVKNCFLSLLNFEIILSFGMRVLGLI